MQKTNTNLSKLLNSGKIKVKKKKTFKNRNSNTKNYLNFLKERKDMAKVRNPISNMVSQNVELMNKQMDKQMGPIPDANKLLSVKVVEKPKIDIKLPSDKSSNVKKITVIDNKKQPTFSFDRTKKKKYMKKKSTMKSSNKKKKKKTNKKPRKITFTVKKPKKNACDKYKKMTEEIDKKDDDDVVNILKGKGIKVSGKNKKLSKDLLKCASNINVKRE